MPQRVRAMQVEAATPAASEEASEEGAHREEEEASDRVETPSKTRQLLGRLNDFLRRRPAAPPPTAAAAEAAEAAATSAAKRKVKMVTVQAGKGEVVEVARAAQGAKRQPRPHTKPARVV